MRKLAIVLALSSTAMAAPALARDGSFYVGIEGGAMIVEDLDLDIGAFNNNATIDHKYGFDVDYVAGIDLGAIRLEGELGYKRAKVDEFQQVAGGGFSGGVFEGGGRTQVISAMINALLDFGDDAGVNGYVGGGVGISQVKFRNVSGTGASGLFLDGKDSELSWQAIAGIRAAVSENVDIGLKYRFFNTTRFELNGDTFGNAFGGGAVATRFPTQGVTGKLRTHSLLASLIYNFGVDEPEVIPEPVREPVVVQPEPEPLPQPEPPRQEVVTPGPFIVFFDWDRSDITPEAASILDNAAAAYQQTGSASVMLAGNADKSGSNSYNVGLSQRRADAVRSYLVGRGLPDGTISSEANGEERPLVDTADGVREPQNRNVQITFGPGSGM